MSPIAPVVKHRETFYPSSLARYDLAWHGSLRIAPRNERLAALERDNRNTGVMIFAETPAFDTITRTPVALEEEVNGQGT